MSSSCVIEFPLSDVADTHFTRSKQRAGKLVTLIVGLKPKPNFPRRLAPLLPSTPRSLLFTHNSRKGTTARSS